ncbi:hypothetical protein IW148_005508 [Coemansia sp. RSA 1199]|nr:hypothetical protein IW148_005508 [Coemansia sp. RSA 1199]
MDKRDDKVRFVYVLAVDTGGRGLDLAQVSFTALFGQSLSPMDAAWFPVNAKYCEDIWRNSTKQQMQSPTSMSDIKVGVGRSQAPPGLGPIEYSGEYNGEHSAAQTRHFGFLRLPIYVASLSCVLFLLTNV